MLLPHTVVASWWVFTGTTTANCPVHGNGNGNGNQNGGNGNLRENSEETEENGHGRSHTQRSQTLGAGW